MAQEVNFWVQNLEGEDIPLQEFREELYEVMAKFGVTKLQALITHNGWFGDPEGGNVVIEHYSHLPECQPVPEILRRTTS